MVHSVGDVAESKKKKCAAHLFEVWSDERQLEPLKTVAGHWKALVIADDTKKLKPFLKLSDEIAKSLISYSKKQEEQCYGCFAVPVNQYWKNKPDQTLRLADLNENWGEVTAGNGNFGVSKKITKTKTEKVKASNVRVLSNGREVRIKIKEMQSGAYYRVSRGGAKRTYYEQCGSGNRAYWVITDNADKINIQTCTINGAKERKMIPILATLKFSKKGIKGVKGKVKAKKAIPGKPIILPKKGFSKSGYKLVGWYQLINGNPVQYKAGGKFTFMQKEKITLYPFFEEKEKPKKKIKKKTNKKGKSKKKKG